jgi:hypothetical protein
MLKELMHSMSMALIREKAVRNFMKRIGSSGEGLTVGWLELRKGFHTFLTPSGDLVVFKDGVLAVPEDVADARKRRPVHQAVDSYGAQNPAALALALAYAPPPGETSGEAGGDELYPQEFVGSVGAWIVICRVVSTKPGDDKGDAGDDCDWRECLSRANLRVLESPADLLQGAFEYSLVLPNEQTCLQLIQHADGKYKPPPALRSIDVKLRAGLPLLVPSLSAERSPDQLPPCPSSLRVVQVTFTYSGLPPHPSSSSPSSGR